MYIYYFLGIGKIIVPTQNLKRMLTIDQLAIYIGLRPQTIRNKYYAGEFPIPAKKIFSKVLFDLKDVDAFLDKIKKIDC